MNISDLIDQFHSELVSNDFKFICGFEGDNGNVVCLSMFPSIPTTNVMQGISLACAGLKSSFVVSSGGTFLNHSKDYLMNECCQMVLGKLPSFNAFSVLFGQLGISACVKGNPRDLVYLCTRGICGIYKKENVCLQGLYNVSGMFERGEEESPFISG